MSDLSSDDFNDLIKQIRGLSGAVGKLTSAVGDDADEREKAAKQLRADMRRQRREGMNRADNRISSMIEQAGQLGRSYSTASNAILQSMRGFVGGAVVGAIMRSGEELVSHYQQMSEIGQNFGGSIMGMQKAAASAALPLGDFAKVMTQNTEIVATMGIPGFVNLMNGVRKTAETHGMYGMTLDQLNSWTGEYMKTARLWGDISHVNQVQAAADISELAGETSALAKVTGKSRTEIMKETQERMRSATVIASMMNMEAGARLAAQKELSSSIAIMAAQFGESGTYLSTLLAETIGAGAAEITQSGKTLIDAGMGHLTAAMNDVAAGRMSEIEYINMFKDEVEANSESLRMLAAAGDENAARVIQYASQMKKLTAAEIAQAKRDAEHSEKLTKMFSNMESVLGRVIGSFKEGFLVAVEPFMKSLGDMVGDEGLGGLTGVAKELGTMFGQFISDTFNPTTMANLGESLRNVGTLVGTFGRTLMDVVGWLAGPGAAIISGAFNLIAGVVTAVAKPFMWLYQGLSMINEKFAGIVTTLAAFVAYRKVMSMGERVINARIVNINAPGAGGSILDGLGGGKKGGKLGRLARVAKAGRLGMLGGAAGVAGGMMGGLGGMAGKGLGMLAKFGPLAMMAGGIDTIGRLSDGDFRGAAISGASTAAGLIPGLGVIAPVLGQALNSYLDNHKEPKDPTTESKKTEEQLAEEREKKQKEKDLSENEKTQQMIDAINRQTEILATQNGRSFKQQELMNRTMNSIGQNGY